MNIFGHMGFIKGAVVPVMTPPKNPNPVHSAGVSQWRHRRASDLCTAYREATKLATKCRNKYLTVDRVGRLLTYYVTSS